jgi:hypothetical protein
MCAPRRHHSPRPCATPSIRQAKRAHIYTVHKRSGHLISSSNGRSLLYPTPSLEIRPNYFISNFIQIFCQLYLILSYFYQVFYQHCPSNIIKYHGFIHMNILNISLIYPSYINTFPDISSTFLFYPCYIIDISSFIKLIQKYQSCFCFINVIYL